MKLRMTDTESMIKVLSEKFDNRFDYSKSIFKSVREKIIIGCYCEKQKEFEQTPEYHKQKGTCPYCARELAVKNHKDRLSIAELIAQFNRAHGEGKYDYSLINEANYTNGKTKIPIICKKHGIFPQEPSSHKKGIGCPKCVKNYRDKEGFINKAIEKGLDKNTSFDKVEYINSYTNVTFTCKIHNIDFHKRPDNFLNGTSGCPECAPTTYHTPESLCIKLKEVYGDEYEFFNLDKYEGVHYKVEGLCKKHGMFRKRAYELINGKGCPGCSIDKTKLTLQEIKEKALKVYGSELDDLSLFEYVNNSEKVTLKCLHHNKEYETTIGNYLQGHRCPSCSSLVSKPEVEVQDFVRKLGFEIETNKRKYIQPYELDIYIPSLKKAIEFNGIYWHYSDKHFVPGKHANKSNLCRAKGIKLLHIREELWIKDQTKMKEVIMKFLEHK